MSGVSSGNGSADLGLEQAILGHTLGFATLPATATVFVALCMMAPPTEEAVDGIELAGGGYVRTPATFALVDASATVAANTASIEFPTAIADWGTVGYFELWDAQTGGNRLYWGQIVDPITGNPMTITVYSGDIVRFSAGTLTVLAASVVGGTISIGGYLPLSGGTLTGPLTLAADPALPLQAVTRQYVDSHTSAGGDIANVLNYGADKTGAADSTTAFRGALATGMNVRAPAGTYRIRGQLTLTGPQELSGDGLGTVLLIDGTFDPNVSTGVVVVTGPTPRPLISDLTFNFVQPPDLVKTTTSGSAAGTNAIVVDSNTGIVVGMSVVDRTQRAGAIPSPIYNTSRDATTVTAIAGNVITLSAAITSPGVVTGDSIQFGAVRSMFKTLVAGGTATPGGTGIQYPWAIWSAAGGIRISNVQVLNAWNGIHIRESTFQLSGIDMFAYNIGLDIDNSFNFCSILDYVSYLFGQSVTGGPQDALANVYYDQQSVAANFGECDGLSVTNFGSFIAQVNILANWTWGSFTNLMLDFDAALNIASNGPFVQITNGYTTVGNKALALPIHITGTCRVSLDNFEVINSSGYPGIQIESGSLRVVNSYLWYGSGTGQPMVLINGGSLYISDTIFDAGGGIPPNMAYIKTGATGAALAVSDCAFISVPASNCVGLWVDLGNTLSFSHLSMNGWEILVNPATLLATSSSNVGSFVVGSFAGGPTALSLTSAPGNQRSVNFYSGNNLRWAAIVDNSTEGGSNAGSNFSIIAASDAGSLLSTPLAINRATGAVTLSGSAIADAFVTGGASGPMWSAGVGAPGHTAPIGSLYSRTTGAVGSTLYVSRGGGTWAAVAGV